jgi:hypothetical protein
MAQPTAAQDPRRVATVIWGAMLAGLVFFLLVGTFAGPAAQGRPVNPERSTSLVFLATALTVAMLVASRILPRLVSPPAPAPGQLALARHVMSCALCEAGALFCIVVWTVTGAAMVLAPFVLALGGLLACFPSEARWAALGGGEPR